MPQLKGKVAIVTGAARGIGQAIATVFAREGASVVIDYIGTPPDETMSKIAALKSRSIAVQADVSDPKDVQMLIARAVQEFGRLDVLVNNAGVETKHPFIDYPFAEFQKIIAIDLAGPWLCAQAAAKQMVSQNGGGRIINISSIHEDLPMPTNAAYCAAKGGLRMLMRTIAVELAQYNICVNNIAPGATYTPIDKDIQQNKKIEEQLMAEIPLRRWGKPEEIGELAAFLASDAAAYITGSTYVIDGGMMRNAGSL